MALVKCPDCGKMFSERIAACPDCGCPVEFATKEEPKVVKYRKYSSVQEAINFCDFSQFKFAKKSIEAAEELITSDEDIYYASTCMMANNPYSGPLKTSMDLKDNNSTGVFILTSKQISYVSKSFSDSIYKQFTYSDVVSTDSASGMLPNRAPLRITCKNDILIVYLDKDDLQKVTGMITSLRSN